MRKQEYYWLVVTADKYELPMFVGDSCSEVAKFLKVSESTVRTLEFRKRNGVITGRKVVKVSVA